MLVPNLNEIMEEYREDAKEAVAESVEKLHMEEPKKNKGEKKRGRS